MKKVLGHDERIDDIKTLVLPSSPPVSLDRAVAPSPQRSWRRPFGTPRPPATDKTRWIFDDERDGASGDTEWTAYTIVRTSIGLPGRDRIGAWRSRKALETGASVDRYRIEGQIGTGGFAVVYRARHQMLQRPLAAKEMFHPQLYDRDDAGFLVGRPNSDGMQDAALDRTLRDAFRREADLVTRLRHRDIVSGHDLVQYNNTLYLFLEWIEGRTLAACAPIDHDQTGVAIHRLFDRLCGAVDHVHAGGNAHCDLTPSNVMIREDGTPVLIDFGSAAPLGDDDAAFAYKTTDGFAPPEQYRVGARTARMDVYGLGATLLTALTGNKPPKSSDLRRSFPAAAALHGLRYAIGARMIDAIQRALSLDAQDRFESIAAFRDEVFPQPILPAPHVPPVPKGERVFLCYRRADNGHFVGRLYDLLAWRCGIDTVFLDVETIPAGIDFQEEIARAMSVCAAVVVLIGPAWRRERTDGEIDHVIQEIEIALRANIPIIPVLFDGAIMPSARELSADAAQFASINAVTVPNADAFGAAGDMIATMVEAQRSAWRRSIT